MKVKFNEMNEVKKNMEVLSARFNVIMAKLNDIRNKLIKRYMDLKNQYVIMSNILDLQQYLVEV
jgi:hypothetical protein